MKKSHLALLKKKRLNNRWCQFEKIFQEYDEAQLLDKSFRPRAVDILVMEPFFTAIFRTDTEGTEFEIDDIDHAAKEWIGWRDNFVFSVLPQDLQDHYRANKLWLQPLAIIYFSEPLNGPIDRVYGHRENIRYCKPQSPHEREIYEAVLQLDLHLGPWKRRNQNLKLDTKHFQVTGDILEYLGMDPFTTTQAQVSECQQTFRCLQCKTSRYLMCDELVSHFSRYQLRKLE
jgi:hypothetical protein